MARAKSNKNIHNEVYLGTEKWSEYIFHVLIIVEQVKLSYREICTKTEYMSKVKTNVTY